MKAKDVLIDLRRNTLEHGRLVIDERVVDSDGLHPADVRLHEQEIWKHEDDGCTVEMKVLRPLLPVCLDQTLVVDLLHRVLRCAELNVPKVLDHMAASQVSDALNIRKRAVAPTVTVEEVERELMYEMAVIAALRRILRQHLPVGAITHLLHTG